MKQRRSAQRKYKFTFTMKKPLPKTECSHLLLYYYYFLSFSSITNDYIHYSFDFFGYSSDTFHVYAGCCEGNQGNSGDCRQADIALNAANYEAYPIILTTEETTLSVAVDSLDTINTGPRSQWTSSYSIFPLENLCSTNTFISAHTCVLLEVLDEDAEVGWDSGDAQQQATINWPWHWGDK